MVCVEGKGKIKIVDKDVQGFSVWVCCLVSGGGFLPLEAMLLVWDGLSADQGQQYKFPVPPSWPASCTLYLQGGNGQKKRLGNRSLPLPACLFSGLKLPCSVLLSLCDSPRSSQPAKQAGGEVEKKISQTDRKITWGARIRQEEIFIDKSPRKKDFIFLIEEFITIVLFNITPAHQDTYVTCQLCLSYSKMKD